MNEQQRGGGGYVLLLVLNLRTELFRPLWTRQRSTEEMRPNLIAMEIQNFQSGPNVPCQSAQTDKSVSSALLVSSM